MRAFMPKALLLAAATVLACAMAPCARAQSPIHPQTREGFTFAFGFAPGRGEVSCEGCDFDSHTGFGGFIRVGGAVNSNLMLGGQMNGWLHSADGDDTKFGFALATAQWYPYTPIGWYGEGGFGLGRVRVENNLTGEVRSRSL